MKNFELVRRLRIKNPSLKITQNKCFLYCNESPVQTSLFLPWLDGKIMDIYEFKGKFGTIRKCPWCDEIIDGNLIIREGGKIVKYPHIDKHGKSVDDVETIKLSKDAYPLLLRYIRNGNYDTLMFLVHKECQYCVNRTVKGREGKCEIPSATRNRPWSLQRLGFECSNFNVAHYAKKAVLYIYRQKPKWRL